MRRLLLIFILGLPLVAFSQKPIMQWDFESIKNRTLIENSTNIADTIEGNFEEAAGVTGKGLRLDGSTTRVIRKTSDLKKTDKEFTIEAWISLGEYPWNWCPVITTESNEVKGYRLMIGPMGQVSLQAAIGEQWISCTSANEILALRKWTHIVGVYSAAKDMKLYVNGEPVVSLPITGSITYPNNTNGIIGMVAVSGKPSDAIRSWGTVDAFYGLDGIIDEIKVFDKVLTSDQIKGDYSKFTVKAPDISPRRLPTIDKNPGRFGAFYTKLKYYPGWDNLWPVDQDPDIVVCFDKSPVKLVFWRGIRYGPCWVSENEIWMADQSLETWGTGKNDTEGCFEHMQDRHCRFSHVRIIENNDARVVVHWRYAPVSSHDNTWLPDPKTGWECWVDEYYYIYPDGSGIRKVSWNKGTVGRAVQYQESLPLLHPGQLREEMLEKNYVNIADYNYNIRTVSEDLRRQPSDWPRNNTVQQFNFKSENKPFICFDPGNRMSVRWIDLGYNHFPVGQARCDGRPIKILDRPSHITSSPISGPVIHENGNRQYWNGLYGMNNMNMTELISFGRSWAYAAGISGKGTYFKSNGYDASQRCYQIENTNQKARQAEFTLQGSKDSPIINPAFFVKNWNSNGAKILVNGKESKSCRIGINQELEGTDLVLFVFIKEVAPMKITILPL
jgi:hypothetical protein